jgi:NADH-quinone oxidoreductase subunit N
MHVSPEQYLTLRTALADQLILFAPELIVAGTIVVLLVLRLFPLFDKLHLHSLAAGSVFVALGALGFQWDAILQGSDGGPAFSGLLIHDSFGTLFRGLLLTFALLALVWGAMSGLPDQDDSADYATLLLGGILGMMLMVSANHLLMMFLAMEMASLPSYALAGFLKGRRAGSEAALKYVLYGSAASGIALYGISLLVMQCGGGSLNLVARRFDEMVYSGSFDVITAAGTLMLLVGFGFKLSAVPFHFWCPDVFEGAAAEVGAFLSVASKTAAVGLTLRFLLKLQWGVSGVSAVHLPLTMGVAVMVVAALTTTLGNLAALAQTNLKRMLAYSTIAHAGYMLMAVSTLSADGTAATLFYLVGYLPTNLGAFAVVAMIRNLTGGETIDHARGLMKRNPAVGVSLTLFLLSLLGLPPLVGFAGKFQVFESVYAAGQGYGKLGQSGLANGFYVLLAVGVVNTVVSAGYYLRVLKAAVLDESQEPTPTHGGSTVRWGLSAFLLLLAAAVVILGLAWNPLMKLTSNATESMHLERK